MKLCPVCQHCYEDTEEVCLQEEHGSLVSTRPRTRLIIDKYRLDTLLARGGMGVIYVGTHLELERPVAIKLLLPNFDTEGQALERFRREARAIARIKHPNIVDIYDYGVLPEGEAYIVMELAQGETLHQHLKQMGRLSSAAALEIARQIAEGMDAAHSNGVVHRDLKPSNIVLATESDGRLRVKIVDFGIAKITQQLSSDDATLTATGTLVGTPRYMSPEQCAGTEVDARSDIYSLGILLYEMLAGRPPFEGDTPVALALKHIHEPPPPITDQRNDVPPLLAQLVAETLLTNPAERPQSAREVAQRLAQLIAVSNGPAADQGHHGYASAVEPAVQPTRVFSPATQRIPASQPIVVKLADETQLRRRRPAPLFALVAIALITGVIGIWSTTRRPHAEQQVQLTSPTPAPTQVRLAQQPRATPKAKPTDSPQAELEEEQQPPKPPSQGDKVEADTDSPTASEVPAQARAELSGALGAWVEATNSGDIKKQMSLYNPHLAAFYLKRDVPNTEVQAEKKRLFERASKIDVYASEPQITISRDGRTAATRFRKRYSIEGTDESRQGEVVQELRWVKTENGWKIISERDLKVIR
jgi:serine/threonine protein kinase